MREHVRAAIAAVVISTVISALGGCGRLRDRIAATRPTLPAPPAAPRAAPPALIDQPSLPTPSAAVWTLRAGLNVAALSCRGGERREVAGEYARLLALHAAVLATAYRQEQARQGMSAFDSQQTRLYNGFANQASPAYFCDAAASVAQRANGLQSAALVEAAPQLVWELRASLAQRP